MKRKQVLRMVCPKCQRVASERHIYCIRCGSVLENPAEKQLEQAVPAAEKTEDLNKPSVSGGQQTVSAPPTPYPPALTPYPPALPQLIYMQRPILYPLDFPAQLIRKLARSASFVTGAIFLIIGVLCHLANLALISFVGPEGKIEGISNTFTDIRGWSQLFVACCAFVPGFLLCWALLRLLRSPKRTDKYLSKSLGMLAVSVVAGVTASLASFVGSLVPDYNILSLDGGLKFNFSMEPVQYWVQEIMGLLFPITLIGMSYFFVYLCVRGIQQAVDTGRPNAQYSIYMAVMLFFGSCTNFLAVIGIGLYYLLGSLITNADLYTYNFGILDLIAIIRGFVVGLGCLFMGIVLCRYSRCTRNGVLS